MEAWLGKRTLLGFATFRLSKLSAVTVLFDLPNNCSTNKV